MDPALVELRVSGARGQNKLTVIYVNDQGKRTALVRTLKGTNKGERAAEVGQALEEAGVVRDKTT